MKILLAYSVTKNLWPAFEQAQEWHSHFSVDARFDRVVVTDHPKQNTVINEIGAKCWVGDEFCLSKCRNASFDYASEIGADWVVLLDADSVVLNWPTQLPETGLGTLLIYRHHAERFDNLELDNPDRWQRMGWYLVRRDLFTAHRYDESFVGYGFEEDDFRHNVLRGVDLEDTDMRAMHIFHALRISEVKNGNRFRSKHYNAAP